MAVVSKFPGIAIARVLSVQVLFAFARLLPQKARRRLSRNRSGKTEEPHEHGRSEKGFYFGRGNAQLEGLRAPLRCVNLTIVKAKPPSEAIHLKGVVYFMVTISQKAEQVLLEYFKGKEISPIRIFLQSGG
ncbi:MAG: hypothetical protein MUC41_15725 [Syntrophobacteraceae bacterium]|jgi:hypothetical protein|nr:hypothetical protein [Syntrophobacteraceae bacterium]